MTAFRKHAGKVLAAPLGFLLVSWFVACDGRRSISLFPATPDSGSPTADSGRRNEPDANCDSRSERCAACDIPGDCERGFSCRFEDHVCVPSCYGKEDCSGGGNNTICALSSGLCVECGTDDDCRDDRSPRCELRTGRCVECVEDDDCDYDAHCDRGECER